MTSTSLVDIKSGKVVEQVNTNQVSVNSPSIVKLSLSPQDVRSYRQSGNDLVVELQSGGQVVLTGFFVAAADGARNELILEDQGRFWHAVRGDSPSLLTLEEISGIDELLVSAATDTSLMWLLGVLGLGGAVAIASKDGKDSSPSASEPSTAPPEPASKPLPAGLDVHGENSGTSTTATSIRAEHVAVEPPATASTQTVPDSAAAEVDEPAPSTPPVIALSPAHVEGDNAVEGDAAPAETPSIAVDLQAQPGSSASEPVTAEGQAPQRLGSETPPPVQAVGNDAHAASAPATTPEAQPVAQTDPLPVIGESAAAIQLPQQNGNSAGAARVPGEQAQGTTTPAPSPDGEPLGVTGSDQYAAGSTIEAPLQALQEGPVDPARGEVPVDDGADSSQSLHVRFGEPSGESEAAEDHAAIKVPPSHGADALPVALPPEHAAAALAQATSNPILLPVPEPLNEREVIDGEPGAKESIDAPAGPESAVTPEPEGVDAASLAAGDGQESVVSGAASANVDASVLAPHNGHIHDSGAHVSVSGRSGEIIRVTDAQGVELGSGTVGEDGSVVIALGKRLGTGDALTLAAYRNGEASPPTTIHAPFIDGERPLLSVHPSISPDGRRVSVQAETGDVVRVSNLDTRQDLGTFTAETQGPLVARIPAQEPGARLSVTVEKDGKTSDPALLLVPVSGEHAPAKPFEVSIDAAGTQVQGKGAPNAIVLVRTADDKTVIGKGLVGSDGGFQVQIASQPGGQLLQVALQHKDKVSASSSVMTPYADSNVPTGLHVDASGLQVTGEGKAGDKIRVKDAHGETIGSGVVRPDGTFVVDIAKPGAGQMLLVTAQGQGPESAPALMRAPMFDAERPPAPSAEVDASGARIQGMTEPGAKVSILDAAGSQLAPPMLAGQDGSFSLDVSGLTAGTALKVVAQVAGQASLPSELIVPLRGDLVVPAPLSASISADGKSVFGKAVPNGVVVVRDASGGVLGEQAVTGDGSYVVPIAVPVGGARLDVLSSNKEGTSWSSPLSLTAPFQLVAADQHVLVGLYVDPVVGRVVETATAKIVTPVSSVVSGVLNVATDLLLGKKYLPTSVEYAFSVGVDERVDVRVSNPRGSIVDVLRSSDVKLEKRVGDEWRTVEQDSGSGVINLAKISILSDANETGLATRYETPGDYRITIKDSSLVGLGNKNYEIEIVRESLAGGFSGSAVVSDLDLAPGTKLLKVNDQALADEVRTAIQGKFGKLLIDPAGQVAYLQDRNVTPSDRTETFTYEARSASGKTLQSTFNVTAKVSSLSGELFARDDVAVIGVAGTPLSLNAEETITGRFGDLRIKANGEYTYVPRPELAGLNQTDSFTYVVEHENGETMASTLHVYIAEAWLVDDLSKVAMASGNQADAASQAPHEVDSEPWAALFELQEQAVELSTLLDLFATPERRDASLAITLRDVLQSVGSPGESVGPPGLWTSDASQASVKGYGDLPYVDVATKKDTWADSGASVL